MWPFNRTETRASLENPNVPLSDPNALALIFGDVGSTAAGITVTEDKALSVPAFWAGYNFLSMVFASLPVHVFRRGDDGTAVKENSDLSRLLAKAPNPAWSSYRWRQYSMQRTLIKGRALTFIIRAAGSDKINRFVPINPSTVKIKVKDDGIFYKAKGIREEFPSADVIDIPWSLKADGVSHNNPLNKIKNTVALSIAYENYRSLLFNNGGIPPLVFEGPFGSPSAAERAAADLDAAISKAVAEGKNGVAVPLGHTVKLVGFNPEQGQLIAALVYLLGEYARFFGIPPSFLQDLSKGTFANTEQAGLQIVKFTLAQWAELWEGELDLKLFPNDDTRFVKFNLDGLLRGDFATRMGGLATGIQNALLTPNEGRELENRPPDSEGGDLLIQGATVPLGSQPRNEGTRDDSV